MQHDDSNFEINLLPVISLLAVLISFLLINAIWVNVGSLDIRQAIGESAEKAKDTPTLHIQVTPKGDLSVTVKNLKSRFKNIKVSGGKKDFKTLPGFLEKVKKTHPELVTATVVPHETTKYQDLIQVFENLKKSEIKDIGVSPI